MNKPNLRKCSTCGGEGTIMVSVPNAEGVKATMPCVVCGGSGYDQSSVVGLLEYVAYKLARNANAIGVLTADVRTLRESCSVPQNSGGALADPDSFYRALNRTEERSDES